MKKKYFHIVLLIVMVITSRQINAQGLSIGAGTTFSLGSSTLSLCGGWSNSGTFTAGSGTVVFNSASGTQTIDNSSGETFNNLTVNKAAGDVQLLNNITVNGILTLTSGDVDMNGNTLTMGSSAVLTETAGNTVKGFGTLTTTRTLSAPSSVNLLGVELTSTANLGSTIINRVHTVQTSGSNNSILRYFEIIPTNNSGLNASLVFHYDDSELNSLTESELLPFYSEDDGANWKLISRSSINTVTNTVSFDGLESLSRYTLASSSAPLPVELAAFTAASTTAKAGQASSATVELNWETATEVNNYGFEIQRSAVSYQQSAGNSPANRNKLNADSWQKIGFVKGSGNSNSPKEYSFVDSNPLSGNVQYRLKQIDNDGGYKYSENVEAKILPTKYELYQNYPNPFNPGTAISYQLSAVSNVTLKIFDILGREVKTLVNEWQDAGYHNIQFNGSQLASGVYFYSIKAGKFVDAKKMTLLK